MCMVECLKNTGILLIYSETSFLNKRHKKPQPSLWQLRQCLTQLSPIAVVYLWWGHTPRSRPIENLFVDPVNFSAKGEVTKFPSVIDASRHLSEELISRKHFLCSCRRDFFPSGRLFSLVSNLRFQKRQTGSARLIYSTVSANPLKFEICFHLALAFHREATPRKDGKEYS